MDAFFGQDTLECAKMACFAVYYDSVEIENNGAKHDRFQIDAYSDISKWIHHFLSIVNG
jgi:hypothetical protein